MSSYAIRNTKNKLCTQYEQLHQTLAIVEDQLECVNSCIGSNTQILHHVFLAFCGNDVVIDACRTNKLYKRYNRIKNRYSLCIQLRIFSLNAHPELVSMETN